MRIAENNFDALKSLLAEIEPQQAVNVLQSMFISYIQRTEYCQLPKSERANIVFCHLAMLEFFSRLQPPEKSQIVVLD